MAVKVEFKGLKQLELNLKNKFNKVTGNTQMLKEIGTATVKKIQFQARVTKPLQGKKVGKFPAGYPKSSTVEARRRIAKYNTTHSTYNAKRANLTITGQLIDGVKFKIKDGIKIFIDGKRKGYKNKNGTRSKSPDNDKVYKELLKRNRKFRILGVDDKLIKVINNIVRRTLRRALKF